MLLKMSKAVRATTTGLSAPENFMIPRFRSDTIFLLLVVGCWLKSRLANICGIEYKKIYVLV